MQQNSPISPELRSIESIDGAQPSVESAEGEPSFAASHSSLGYMVQLDALRAIAVIGVLVWHYLPEGIGINRIPSGIFGVRLFYVLSGFLISSIVLQFRTRDKNAEQPGQVLKAFYIRRFLRIFPLYYGCIALLLLLGDPRMQASWPWHVSYLSNVQFFVTNSWGDFAHFWSLAVEEQFYLVWPALLLFVPRAYLVPLILMAIVSAPCFRAAIYLSTRSDIQATVLMPACLDTLGAGALIAYFSQLRPDLMGRVQSLLRWALVPAVIGCTLVILENGAIRWIFADMFTGIVFGCVVLECALGYRGWGWQLLEWRPLLYLGTISYGVYVIHMLVPHLIAAVHRWFDITLYSPYPGYVRLIYFTVITIVLATFSWFLFERPINQLKRYFPYSPKSTTRSMA